MKYTSQHFDQPIVQDPARCVLQCTPDNLPEFFDVLERFLNKLTLKQLRSIGSMHFNGCLGGVSKKSDIASEMVSQLRAWWLSGSDSASNYYESAMDGIRMEATFYRLCL